LVKATELSAKELENLRLSDEDGKKNMEAIAREQRDLLEKIYDEGVAARKTALGDAIAGESETFTNFRDNIERLGTTFMDMTNQAMKDGSLLRTGTEVLSDQMVNAAEKFNNGADVFSKTMTDLQDFLKNIITGGSGGFSAEESFANDLVSLPGYGGRVLSGPEGSISLNDDDTIIAGTDLFPNEQRRRNTSQLMGNLPQDVSNMLNNLGSSESPNISFEDLQITHSGTIRLEGDGRFLTLDMLANNPQMLENLTNMIKQRMSSQTMGYNNA